MDPGNKRGRAPEPTTREMTGYVGKSTRSRTDPETSPSIYADRHSTGAFLIAGTSKIAAANRGKEVSAGTARIFQQSFPSLETGTAFVEHSLSLLGPLESFAAMAVQLDDAGNDRGPAGPPKDCGVLLESGRVLERVCRREAGWWGLWEETILGAYFPDRGPDFCLGVAREIKRQIPRHLPGTVTVGIAVYPTADFAKEDILENTRKALDHAAFLGPDSVVALDAVSLNISGDKSYECGDMDGAVREFLRALCLDPSNMNVHNSLGVCYGVLGRLRDALACFEEAMRLESRDVMPVYNAGLARMLLGDHEKALALFVKADGVEADVFEVLLQTGRAHLALNRPLESAVFLERAAGIRPDAGAAHRYLGDAYVASERFREASKAYEKAVRLNPNDAASLSNLGEVYSLLGENTEIAVAFSRQSVALAPANGFYRFRLARLYEKQARFEESLRAYREAESLGHPCAERIERLEAIERKGAGL